MGEKNQLELCQPLTFKKLKQKTQFELHVFSFELLFYWAIQKHNSAYKLPFPSLFSKWQDKSHRVIFIS